MILIWKTNREDVLIASAQHNVKISQLKLEDWKTIAIVHSDSTILLIQLCTSNSTEYCMNAQYVLENEYLNQYLLLTDNNFTLIQKSNIVFFNVSEIPKLIKNSDMIVPLIIKGRLI
jgi:hypothetical protein